MIKNPFAQKVMDLEQHCATPDELREFLGEKRERLGIFEGNWEEGQFEAGMGAGMIHEILPAADVVKNLVREYQETISGLCSAE